MTKLWEKMPAEMLAGSIFVPGGAFRMNFQFADEGMKFRYLFVLNHNPQTNKLIILATATTNIEGRKKCRDSSELVELGPNEYDELEKQSVIDCSSPFEIGKNVLEKRIASKEIIPLSALPPEIFSQIKNAVRGSKIVRPDIKKRILDDKKK